MTKAGRWSAGVLGLAVIAAGAGRAMEVKPGGVVYAQYTYETSPCNSLGVPGRDRSEFAMTRIYAILDAKASDDWRGRVTLEGNATTAGNPLWVKHAFIEAVNVWPDGNVSLGLTPAAWIGFEEEIWGRRYVAKVLTDQEGMLYASDRGLAASGKLPGGYGTYRAGVFDGEGLLAPEQTGLGGRYKDGSARLSLTPAPLVSALAGVRVHGFAQVGKLQTGTGRGRARYIAGASWEGGFGTLAGTWLWARTGGGPAVGYVKAQGCSGYGAVNLPARCAVFARGDWFDPSSGVGGDARVRVVAGVEKTVADGVRLALDNQHVRQQRTTAARKHENLVLLQAELRF